VAHLCDSVDADHSWKVGCSRACEPQKRGRFLILLAFSSRSVSCGFADSIPHGRHACPSTSPTVTRGGGGGPPPLAVGGRLRGAGGVAHAPSLLRRLCWGACRAAQTAARPGSERPASTSAPSMNCGASVSEARWRCIPVGKSSPLRHGGQPRLGVASPSSAPIGERTSWGRRMVEFQQGYDPRTRRPSS
jgi:hypothetical protein